MYNYTFDDSFVPLVRTIFSVFKENELDNRESERETKKDARVVVRIVDVCGFITSRRRHAVRDGRFARQICVPRLLISIRLRSRSHHEKWKKTIAQQRRRKGEQKLPRELSKSPRGPLLTVSLKKKKKKNTRANSSIEGTATWGTMVVCDRCDEFSKRKKKIQNKTKHEKTTHA